MADPSSRLNHTLKKWPERNRSLTLVEISMNREIIGRFTWTHLLSAASFGKEKIARAFCTSISFLWVTVFSSLEDHYEKGVMRGDKRRSSYFHDSSLIYEFRAKKLICFWGHLSLLPKGALLGPQGHVGEGFALLLMWCHSISSSQ